jgi:hypothetical protein
MTSSTGKYPSFNTSLGRIMPSGQDLQQLAADISAGFSTFPDAPVNGNLYGRINASWAIIPTSPVTAVAGKTGNVTLNHNDITDWASATASFLTGNQTITLGGDLTGTGSTAITATLATVNGNVGTFQGLTVNAKGLVTAAANMNYAPLNSPVLTGTPTAPTPSPGDNSNNIATTAFVDAAVTGGGYVLPTASTTVLGGVRVDGTTVTIASGVISANFTGSVTYAQLPAEVQKVPVSFAFPGVPTAGAMVNAPSAMALTVAAALTGTVVYDGTLTTANAVFTLNKISGGVTTQLGTVTITNSSHTSATLAGAGGSLAIGDVLQLVAPTTADATLADIGITILAMRV